MSPGTDSPRERHGGRRAATLAFTLLAFAGALAIPAAARSATVSGALKARLAASSPGQVPVLITLRDQVDDSRYERRPAAMIRALRDAAHHTQGGVTAGLDGPSRHFWLVNALATDASAEEVAALADDPAVESIDLDPVVRVTGAQGAGTAEGSWGVDAVRAPAVWSRYGLTGAGVRVGSIDTGVDAANPELAGAIAGWRDFVNGSPTPYDDNGHGTHTIGTMVARNIAGGHIGVAPGAQVVVAKAIRADGTAMGSDLLAAAQWLTDPDGDPATPDFPAVINNSWTSTGADNEWFRPMVQAWTAMGIVPVFGAGNTAGTIGNPASYPETIAVGALEEDGTVAADSSSGLLNWTVDGAPTQVVKPDITAPGVYITSTLGAGYGMYTGTSMAAPHVAGAIALIKQARPDLDVVGVRRILLSSPRDRGAPGPDLQYGAGALNALAAVAATGAPELPQVTRTTRAKRTVRVLRVFRRGSTWFVRGSVNGPARMRVLVLRPGASTNARAKRATRSVAVRRGRFVLRVPTRGLSRGRYVLMVTAADRAGTRLGRASHVVRLR